MTSSGAPGPRVRVRSWSNARSMRGRRSWWPTAAVALTALGAHVRDRLDDVGVEGRRVAVIGVTGSVGKTSVKDLVASATAPSRRTAASLRSFNNEVGVPLTLLEAPDDTEVAVIEMGARGLGHVADLCRVARPTIGVVTAVALAHTEAFGAIEEVARAKGELVESLAPEGTAVLNLGDERVAAMAQRTVAGVLTYGVDQGDVRAEGVVLDDHLRPRFRLVTPWGDGEVDLEVRGRHNAENAAGAAAAALAAGAELDGVLEGLAAATLSPWRMELAVTPGGLRMLNDAYNANPTSMAAALEALAELDAVRRTAVVGPMAELGHHAEAEHTPHGRAGRPIGDPPAGGGHRPVRPRSRGRDGVGRGAGRPRPARGGRCSAGQGQPGGRPRAPGPAAPRGMRPRQPCGSSTPDARRRARRSLGSTVNR